MVLEKAVILVDSGICFNVVEFVMVPGVHGSLKEVVVVMMVKI